MENQKIKEFIKLYLLDNPIIENQLLYDYLKKEFIHDDYDKIFYKGFSNLDYMIFSISSELDYQDEYDKIEIDLMISILNFYISLNYDNPILEKIILFSDRFKKYWNIKNN